jgi:hypothetical protein
MDMNSEYRNLPLNALTESATNQRPLSAHKDGRCREDQQKKQARAYNNGSGYLDACGPSLGRGLYGNRNDCQSVPLYATLALRSPTKSYPSPTNTSASVLHSCYIETPMKGSRLSPAGLDAIRGCPMLKGQLHTASPCTLSHCCQFSSQGLTDSKLKAFSFPKHPAG